MASILLWIGIAITLIGWIALAFQAAKRIAVKDELEGFPDRTKAMRHQRNYCWLTIITGTILILFAIII